MLFIALIVALRDPFGRNPILIIGSLLVRTEVLPILNTRGPKPKPQTRTVRFRV